MHSRFETAIILTIFGIAVAMLTGHNFYRYYIAKDYPIHAFTTCNPSEHSCFIADPNSADPTFQKGPYEKVLMGAKFAPHCLDEHTCGADFSCPKAANKCEINYCSSSVLSGGESCTSGKQ